MHSFESQPRLALAVLQPDAEPLFPLDQKEGLTPRANLGRLPFLIGDKVNRRRDALAIALRLDAALNLQSRRAVLKVDLAELFLFEVVGQSNIKIPPRADRIDPLLQPKKPRHRQPARFLFQIGLFIAPPLLDRLDVIRLRLAQRRETQNTIARIKPDLFFMRLL